MSAGKKGIVRSNQESTNLRVYARAGDVTAAECLVRMSCEYLVRVPTVVPKLLS